MAGSRRGAGAVALAALCLFVGACTPSSGETPSPTPSPSAASPTPTETAIERQERLDYAAAEKSYRAFRKEYSRVVAAGGALEATSQMSKTATGDYLASYVDVAKGYKESNYHQRGAEKIVFIRKGGHSATRLVLDVCEDSREAETFNSRNQFVGRGEIRTASLEVKRVGGLWKVADGTGKKVSKCPN